MDRLLNSMTALSLVMVLVVLFSVRRARIRVEYSVSWLAASIVLLVLSRSRWWLDAVSHYLGIFYPPMALAVIVGFLFLLVLFRFSIVISKLKDDNIALAQRLAIVEYHVQTLRSSSPTEVA